MKRFWLWGCIMTTFRASWRWGFIIIIGSDNHYIIISTECENSGKFRKKSGDPRGTLRDPPQPPGPSGLHIFFFRIFLNVNIFDTCGGGVVRTFTRKMDWFWLEINCFVNIVIRFNLSIDSIIFRKAPIKAKVIVLLHTKKLLSPKILDFECDGALRILLGWWGAKMGRGARMWWSAIIVPRPYSSASYRWLKNRLLSKYFHHMNTKFN